MPYEKNILYLCNNGDTEDRVWFSNPHWDPEMEIVYIYNNLTINKGQLAVTMAMYSNFCMNNLSNLNSC